MEVFEEFGKKEISRIWNVESFRADLNFFIFTLKGMPCEYAAIFCDYINDCELLQAEEGL